MPPSNPRLLDTVRRDLATARAERQQLEEQLAQYTVAIGRVDAEIQALTEAGDLNAARDREAERQGQIERRRQAASRLRVVDDRLREVIDGLRDVDPCDADPSVPLLLLPVRLETRYTADRSALRVRIFPDDVHIDQLDRGLSDEEQEAGRLYWNAAWRAPDDEQIGNAWRALLERVGARRALWTALALSPTNLAQRGIDAAPLFGETGPRTKRPAVARLLPDHFTAVAIQDGVRSVKTGLAVAPVMTVGIFADDGSELKNVNGVQVVAGAEWLADYGEAERVGMALTLPLQRPGAPVDRLFVFGVSRSTDPAAMPAELESLLVSHRCARGVAFVPQGTPTNNTESDRATWQRRPEPQPPRVSTTAPDPGSNAQVLAAALGISPESLDDVPYAQDREQPLASAMNVALWGPTWATFLDKIEVVGPHGPTMTEATREQMRQFHRDHVRGRGPLPALRIGRQPYGILPVSALDARWRSGDPFEEQLVQLLRRLRAHWRAAAGAVPRIGNGRIDETLRELLGSSAVSVALRVRTVLSDDAAQTATTVTGLGGPALAMERLIDELLWEQVISDAALVRRTGSVSEQSRPLSLALVDDQHDAAAIASIMAGGSPRITSVLQALVALAWDRAQRDVAAASAHGRLQDVVALSDAVAADTRERVLGLASRADTVDAATFHAEADRVSQAAGPAATVLPTLAEFQPVEAVRRSFSELALSSTTAASRTALGLFGTVAWLRASGRLAELRAALTALIQPPSADALPDSRRLLVAEALDIASHRLDAWLTGVVDRRRAAQRAQRPEGLTIGAYGWVERVAPDEGDRGDGGFVHAPSLAHATTAGILRSAYLSHNADADGSGAFAIDLTSRRVRTAKYLIEGVRQGQPLGALLGYQIERRVHEAGLDRLVLTLRTIAPVSQGKLTDRGESVPQASIEALAAANVTEGVQLVEKYQGKVDRWDQARIRAQLNARPTSNPYLTGEWPPLTDGEWAVVASAIEEAAAACDAVADVLLAESVHQLAQGNVSRASAALDAAGTGDAPPPDPDVVASPVAGAPLTHRLLIVAAEGPGWNTTRPRSRAEPRLEAWAAERLGEPATIVIGADGNGRLMTVAETGLCALDLVYDAGDRSLFDQRLRAALPTLAPDAPLADTPDDGWDAGLRAIGDLFELASALRGVLATARPASPLDLAVPNAAVLRAVDGAEVAAVRGRVQDAADSLRVRAAALEAILRTEPIDPVALSAALQQLAAFGVALPVVSGSGLANVAYAVLAEAARRLKSAQALLDASPTRDNAIAAGQAIFGEGFWMVPAVAAPAAADAWLAACQPGAVTAPPAEIRRYLADAASVRDNVRRYSNALLLAEAVGKSPALRVAQVSGVGGAPPARWIGGPLADGEPTPNVPVASAVLDASGEYDGSGPTVALVVDQWVDVLPVRERRGPQDAAIVDQRVTTAVSFNARAASARAPQAMLLAISPDGERWTTDALLDTLHDVLDLAVLRGVTLERTAGIAHVLPALYAQSWSLQGEKVLDLRFVSEQIRDINAIAAFVKEDVP